MLFNLIKYEDKFSKTANVMIVAGITLNKLGPIPL